MQSTHEDTFNAIVTSVADDDAFIPAARPDAKDFERWDAEWLEYLGREWPIQFTPHTALPLTPPLPEAPSELIHLGTAQGWELALYCDRDWLAGKRVMELGCGCGNLGKQLGRYVQSYLGVDFSPLALQVARLVSPDNCRYVHIADDTALEALRGTIDTVVGRYFWIHQNFEMGRRNLDLMQSLLRPGGRIYADFFWPAPGAEHYVVLPPDGPMSKTHTSAMFRYRPEDVDALIAGRPLRIVREEISVPMERRYVVLERT